jgi:ABC-2 type transport system ATP-binding protein
MLAIDIKGLRKTYKVATGGTYEALRGVDLEVQEGHLFGFVGVNGAGKSTLIKSLIGLIHFSQGEAKIFGHPAGSIAARECLGYLPEVANYHEFMSARELLAIHAGLAKVPSSEIKARCEECLEQVGLGARRDTRISEYSKGMKQRFGIAQALVGKPKLLILDELTSGLDPKAQLELREITATLKRGGTTIFFSSHHMNEVEAMCDHVAILHRGLIRAQGTLDQLLAPEQKVRMAFTVAEEAKQTIRNTNQQISDDPEHPGQWIFPKSQTNDVLAWLNQNSGQLTSLSDYRESLEHFYLKTITEADAVDKLAGVA